MCIVQYVKHASFSREGSRVTSKHKLSTNDRLRMETNWPIISWAKQWKQSKIQTGRSNLFGGQGILTGQLV